MKRLRYIGKTLKQDVTVRPKDLFKARYETGCNEM